MAQRSRRSGRIFIYLALILLLIVLAVWLVISGRLPGIGITSAQQPTAGIPIATPVTMVDVVFTSQSIPRGTAINADELITQKIPQSAFDSAAGIYFTKIDDIVGKVAKVDLPAQVLVTRNLIVENGSLNAQEIPSGMVAISIPLKDRISSVSYAPQAGDHVNIIAAFTFVDLNTNSQTVLPDKVGQVTAPVPVEPPHQRPLT